MSELNRGQREQQNAEQDENRLQDDLLNENHRRVLATTLRRVELAARRLEDQLLRGEPPKSALTRFTHPPDTVQRATLLQLTQQVRQEVAKLASDYHLETGEQNLLRSIMGEFSLLWSDLGDSRPQKLRAYGAIDPRAQPIRGTAHPAIDRPDTGD